MKMRRIATTVFVPTLLVACGCEREGTSSGDKEIVVSGEGLSGEISSKLNATGWNDQVGESFGLWVSIARRRVIGIKNRQVLFVYRCSTAARGPGNAADSYKTPLGWHRIDERFGDGLPWGAVLKERKYTGEIWNPSRSTTDDLILSRILWLRGLEPGVNSGPRVDSHARYIYIHGTAEEGKLGTPASHGCVRLSNDDVIELFDVAQSGTRVLITPW
ncbi:MAG: L,D-transpeptidase [Planctomycetota bacterium]|nr:L,D-transpeptidase [Planctomycetota bacterium]